MKKDKIILLFSDLEGTILRERDGDYDDETMHIFLSEIAKLQKLTEAKVNIHLISPVYKKQMEHMVERIDRNISSFNLVHGYNGWNNSINLIEGASCYPEEIVSDEFLGDRIVPLKKPIGADEYDIARYGKYNYVRQWCEVYNESQSKELLMSIYCGNGRNDSDAMTYVKTKGKGMVVCPINSRTEVRQKANFVSQKEDLKGITEGIQFINRALEKRFHTLTDHVESEGKTDKEDDQYLGS